MGLETFGRWTSVTEPRKAAVRGAPLSAGLRGSGALTPGAHGQEHERGHVALPSGSSSRPTAAREQSLDRPLEPPSLAFPSFPEAPVLPLPSGLPASLPASPRRDGERQACYKLVLSPRRLPLITSWGGHKGRPGARAGLLPEERSLTQLSTLGPARADFAPDWPRRPPTPPGQRWGQSGQTPPVVPTRSRLSLLLRVFPFFCSSLCYEW